MATTLLLGTHGATRPLDLRLTTTTLGIPTPTTSHWPTCTHPKHSHGGLHHHRPAAPLHTLPTDEHTRLARYLTLLRLATLTTTTQPTIHVRHPRAVDGGDQHAAQRPHSGHPSRRRPTGARPSNTPTCSTRTFNRRPLRRHQKHPPTSCDSTTRHGQPTLLGAHRCRYRPTPATHNFPYRLTTRTALDTARPPTDYGLHGHTSPLRDATL